MTKSKTIKPTFWSTELSNCDITMLAVISDDIDKQLNRAAGAFIVIGNLLNQARTMFIGDKEFGQWREKHTSVNSGKTASAYMSVARRFSEHSLVPKVSYSVLRELASAPDDVVKEAERIVDEGAPLTTADAKALKNGGALGEPGSDASLDSLETGPGSSDTPVPATVGSSSASDTDPGTPGAGRSLERQDGPLVASERMDAGEYVMVALSPAEVGMIIDALIVNPTTESAALAERLKEDL